MSDRPHLSSPQLQMFMPARQLMQMDSSDASAVTTPDGALKDTFRSDVPYEKAEQLIKDNIEESRDPEYYAQYNTPLFKRLNQPHIPLEESNLYDDVKKRGVVKPVHVTIRTSDDSMELVDGHHRVAIAHDINPGSEVPVFYTETHT
jgi:hypothetical protein